MPRPTAAFAAAVLVAMIFAAPAATFSSSMIAPDAAGFGHGGGEVRDDARGAGRSLQASNTHTNPEFSVFQATTPNEKESEHAVLFVSLTLLVVIVLQFAHHVLLPEAIKTILPEYVLLRTDARELTAPPAGRRSDH